MLSVDLQVWGMVLFMALQLANTALLVWNQRQVDLVRSDVNGARVAAEDAAHQAGYVKGVIASTRPPLSFPPPPAAPFP